MDTEPMAARGIRLPNQLWEAIDAEAESLQMTRSDYLRRRLSAMFFNTAQDAKKNGIAAKKSGMEPIEELA